MLWPPSNSLWHISLCFVAAITASVVQRQWKFPLVMHRWKQVALMHQDCSFGAMVIPSSCARLFCAVVAFQTPFYQRPLKRATAVSKSVPTYLRTAAESPDSSHSTSGYKVVLYSMNLFWKLLICLSESLSPVAVAGGKIDAKWVSLEPHCLLCKYIRDEGFKSDYLFIFVVMMWRAHMPKALALFLFGILIIKWGFRSRHWEIM